MTSRDKVLRAISGEGPAQTLEADTPAANVLAFVEAVAEGHRRRKEASGAA